MFLNLGTLITLYLHLAASSITTARQQIGAVIEQPKSSSLAIRADVQALCNMKDEKRRVPVNNCLHAAQAACAMIEHAGMLFKAVYQFLLCEKSIDLLFSRREVGSGSIMIFIPLGRSGTATSSPIRVQRPEYLSVYEKLKKEAT